MSLPGRVSPTSDATDTSPATLPGDATPREGQTDAATLVAPATTPRDDDDPADSDLSPETAEHERLPITRRGSYEIAGKFAQGGIGRILRAHDPVLGRTVALKELLVAGHRTDERRFVREVLLTARLQHPGIVPVYAAGRWPSGEPFYAMKLVSGRSYDRVIAGAVDLPARLALLPHVLAIAETLAFAHAQNIIHRDLKPNNVLVGEFGETVVIDWGLAKQLGEPDDERDAPDSDAPDPTDTPGLTRVGAVVGTPGFMAPEQASSAAVDARSDVYALGVILYQTLTGALPHDADNATELLYKTVYADPVPLLQREPHAPEELAAIVDKAMAREPGERYPTAKAMADDLRRFQTGQIVGAHRYTPWELLLRVIKRYRAPLAVAAVALLIVVVTVTVSFRSVATQRDIAVTAESEARAAETEALQARNDALKARNEAIARADDLALGQARLRIDSDPMLALDLLHRTSPGADWRRIRQIAAAIEQRGIPIVMHGHQAAISRAVFSPDGDRLATTSDDCTLRVWNLSDRTSRAYFGHTDEVWRAAWSPDQRHIASTSRDQSVRLWDLETGDARVLLGHRAGIRNVSFSADGRAVYSIDDAFELRRWDLATGTSDILDRCIGSAFPWDERQISCVDETANELHLHDLRTGRLHRFRGDGVRLGRNGASSPDGRWVATGGRDGSVQLWSREDNILRRLAPLKDSAPGEPRELRFSADSQRMLVPMAQSVLAVHDLTAGTIQQLTPHSGYTRRAVFSPSGAQIASVGGDIGVKLSDLDTLSERSLAGAPALMIDVQYSRSGSHLATVGSDPRVFVWAADEFRGHSWRIPGEGRVRLADAPAAEATAFIRDRSLVVLDTRTLEPRLRLVLPEQPSSLALARDASVVLATHGDVVAAWDVASGVLLHERRLELPVCVLGPPLADALRVVLRCADGAHVLDLRDETRVDLDTTPRPHLVVEPTSGLLLSGENEGDLRSWSPQTSETTLLWHYRGHIQAMVPVPGLPQMVLISDRLADLWDLEQRRSWPLPGHTLNINSVDVSADGRRIATNSRDNVLRIFDRESRTLLQSLTPRVLLGGNLRLSPDGGMLISNTHDQRLLLWDLAAGADALLEPRELTGHRSLITILRFAADGASMLSVDEDGRAIRWADGLPRDRDGVRRWVAQHHDPRSAPPVTRTGCVTPPELPAP